MKNRFRFRAWNIIVNRYEYFDFNSLAKMDYDKIQWHILKFEQCTGLKDKNGNLIYEGDILLLDPDDPHALVVWNEDVAMFCLEQEDVCYTFDNCGYSPQEMEVIGNIHENPELLEGK